MKPSKRQSKSKKKDASYYERAVILAREAAEKVFDEDLREFAFQAVLTDILSRGYYILSKP